jgi:hypothetical protein
VLFAKDLKKKILLEEFRRTQKKSDNGNQLTNIGL